MHAILIASLWSLFDVGSASGAESPRGPAVQQLRIYEIYDDTKQAFHDRFRDHAMRIMARYGFEIVATWETANEGRVEFAYLLEWPDEATMQARWAKFMADEEWKDIKQRTRGDRPLVRVLSDRTLKPTSYSPSVAPPHDAGSSRGR